MSNKAEIRARIEEIGIIPGIRLASAEDAIFAAEAVSESGIPIVEVTMTIPGALEVIGKLTRNNPGLVVGAGTVIDLDTADRCLNAGAHFLTSTGLDLEIVDFAQKHDIVVFPGAMTPTEVSMAWRAGADFVKVFPCSQLGGPSYIRTLKSPFPKVPLIAAGGVNQQTVGEFFLAGAVAVGIGRDLIQPDAIERREKGWIRELAHRYLRKIEEARSRLRK